MEGLQSRYFHCVMMCMMAATLHISSCASIHGGGFLFKRNHAFMRGISAGSDLGYTKTEEYTMCLQVMNTDLCKECFSSESNTISTSRAFDRVTETPVTSEEIARVSSASALRLAADVCRSLLRTFPLPRRQRRSAALQVAEPSFFLDAVYEKYGTTHDLITTTGFEVLLADLGIGLESNANSTTSYKCYAGSSLLGIYNMAEGITKTNFDSICPSLIQQVTEGCIPVPTQPEEMSLDMYGWATLAVFTITIISMLCMLAVPTTESRFYAAAMQLFVGLAVSSLSGDALLHLLPEALGLSTLEYSEGEPNPLLIILTIITSLYFFFLFERVMSLLLKETPHGHGHIHTRPRRETFCPQPTDDAVIISKTTVSSHEDEDEDTKKADTKTEQLNNIDDIALKAASETDLVKEQNDNDNADRKICGMNSLVLMILLGDIIHNITDGLTIGASFSSGIFDGVSTSIAVFFHEIPHEIGDFAVMIRSGMSFKKAMLCSLISNLIGFIGLYAGLLLGAETSLHRWIFAATAGMFLYIALVSLIPEMNQQAEESASRDWHVLLRHNIGLLTGWAIMLGIAVVEQINEN